MTDNRMAVLVLRVAIMGIVFLGAVAPGATAVFSFSDPMMGILAVVNLLALMMLFPVAMRIIADFRAQLAAGVTMPVFDPAHFPDLDTDPSAWPDAPSVGTTRKPTG
jgi:AGCS family alanine or glycine:cation symporter